MKKVTNDIYYVGVNDHKIDLFEGQYDVPNGMAYNSYVVNDDVILIFDTVDVKFFDEWIKNVKEVLVDKKPTYLVVQHMEPDHSANIVKFLEVYPDTTVIGNKKTFQMMEQFFDAPINNRMYVENGEVLNTKNHSFVFTFAPMVHWPEVMMTYDSASKVIFSADAFGKFGALDVEEEWDCEARRYYFGIVGKYGTQVQAVLKKVANLEIKIICPLHGPILSENLGHYLNLYNTWSSYQNETEGVAIFYTSVYGHTKQAVELLEEELKKNGAPKIAVTDLARCDMAEAVEDAFRYGKIILATTTYNASIFPFMNEFINELVERNYQNKTIGLIENGTWAPLAAKVMKDKFANCKNITFIEPVVKLLSSIKEENKKQIADLANRICEEYIARKELKANNLDITALFKIGYGLYVVTTNDGRKDNGLIVNTVSQVTNSPNRVAVCVSKANYSHNTIKTTKKLNVNVLSIEAPFSIFQKYGFVSGKDVDKMKDVEITRSANGLAILPQYINAYMSLSVRDYVDLDTHGMFICDVEECKNISNVETMTYTYYQKNVKPKPEAKTKGWVCKVCGYVYEGEELPDDFICPLCKHGKDDFEKVQ